MEPSDSRTLGVRFTVDKEGLQTVTLIDDSTLHGGTLEARWAASGGFGAEALLDMRDEIWGWISAHLSGKAHPQLQL